MSLINEVLKDLDKRRHATTSENNILKDIYSHAHVDKQTLKRYFVWGLTIVVAIAFVISIWFIVKTINARPAKVATKPATQVVTHVTPVQIPKPQLSVLARAIAVTGDAMSTQLTIFLNKTTRYSMLRDAAQNKLTIILDNTELTEPLLPLNNRQTAIKDVQAVNDGNQLKVILTLLPDIEVQSLNMNESTSPQLVLILANKNQMVSGITSTTSDNLTINDADAVKLKTAEAYLLKSNPTNGTFNKDITTQTTQQYAESNWRHAMDLIQENQTDDAMAVLKDLLAQAPNYTPARTALVTLLLENNQIEEAQEEVNEGLENQPGIPALTKLAAQIYLLQQQPQRALAILKTASPEMVTDPDYYSLMAALYLRTNQPRQAARLYDQLVTQYPTSDILWVGFGSALEALNETHAARQAYQNAIMDDNLSPSLRNYVKSRIQALQ